MTHSVLLDTSFLIRLLNENDRLHQNALGYFKYCLDKGFTLKCSTISIAEYCVKGKFDELPWRNLQVLPFNTDHGIRAGEFANIVFKEKGTLDLTTRNIIPNDTKLFAQADIDKSVKYFMTSDQECKKIYKIVDAAFSSSFEIVDINMPYNERFGILDL